MTRFRFAGDAFERDANSRPGEIASIHDSLDYGKTGLINDSDPTHYLHKGGQVFKGHMPDAANPIPGGKPGAKEVRDLNERDYRHLDQIHRQLDHERIMGPPGMA